jgi:hypothetical protein
MWSADAQSGRFVVTSRLQRGTRRVVVFARLWPHSRDSLVKIGGCGETDIALFSAGQGAYGACNLPEGPDAELRIETSVPPDVLTCWSFSRVHPSDLWRRALPASLIGRVPEPRSTPRVSCETITAQLARGDLSDVLGEVASTWLGGGSEERFPVTKAVLEHLDCHPLQRTSALGAFVAALCQPQRAT